MVRTARVCLCVLVLSPALLANGCGEESPSATPVAAAVSEQLRYLEPGSSLVVAVDLRFAEDNWKHVQELISRGLREYRNVDPDAGLEVPPNLTGALNQLAGFAGVSFEEDLEPLLDGYLVVGLTVVPTEAEPEQRTVATYRTEGDGLGDLIEKVTEGDELRPVAGHPDALLIDSSSALVDGDTLVFVEGPDADSADVARALDRAEGEEGFPAARLEAAQRTTGSDDPLVLAVGTLDLGGLLVDGPALRRARREVPLLRATRDISAAVDIDDEGLRAGVRMSTDSAQLSAEDLPLGPAGPLELPNRDGAVVGASRDQSVTTAFATRLARSLFADSRFVRAVVATEAKLDIDFEQEFLRQFDCPSVSVLDAADPRRFAARSCVNEPERMRALLPRLTPELPKILTALQSLQSEGLAALLLIAPDAPLTPSFGDLLAAVTLQPLGDPEGGRGEERLYELRGLQDPGSRLALVGPDRVVFGMIGDDFVVGSGEEQVRDIAEIETEGYSREAASATRVPIPAVLGASDDIAGRLASRLIGELAVSAAGDVSGIEIDLALPFADD